MNKDDQVNQIKELLEQNDNLLKLLKYLILKDISVLNEQQLSEILEHING